MTQRKAMTAKRSRSKACANEGGLLRAAFGLVLALVVVVLIGGLFVAPRLLETYRPQLTASLSRVLDRKVEIKGPLGVSLSWQNGVQLSVADVSIGNPAWAKGPALAKLDRLALGVGIQPLLHKTVEIKSFVVEGADIQLETAADGRTNWDFSSVKKEAASESPSASPTVQPTSAAGAPMQVVLRAGGVSIHNSRIALRAPDGSVTRFQVDSLRIVPKGADATEIHFAGILAGHAVKMDLMGGALEKIMTTDWPVSADLAVSGLVLSAKGKLSNGAKLVTLDTYRVAANGSEVGGKLLLDLRGAKPSFSGTLVGERVDPTAFRLEESGSKAAPQSAAKAESGVKNKQGLVLSSEPLPLDGLKAVDVDLGVRIAALTAGSAAVQDLQANVRIKGGALTVAPFKMKIGDRVADGTLRLDASRTPAALEVAFNADKIDLASLATLGGFESFVRGTGHIDLSLTAHGASPHALASSANGHFDMIVASGTLYGKVLDGVGDALAKLLGGGGNDSASLNCMAARYVFKDGVMNSNGVVFDTDVATVVGAGGIDFHNERLNMTFAPQSKTVGVGTVLPAVLVSGTLADPHYGVDAAASVEKITGLLSHGLSALTGPTAGADTGSQNACAAYASKTASKSNGMPSVIGAVLNGKGSVGEKIDNVGKVLQKSLGSGLFKGF